MRKRRGFRYWIKATHGIFIHGCRSSGTKLSTFSKTSRQHLPGAIHLASSFFRSSQHDSNVTFGSNLPAFCFNNVFSEAGIMEWVRSLSFHFGSCATVHLNVFHGSPRGGGGQTKTPLFRTFFTGSCLPKTQLLPERKPVY